MLRYLGASQDDRKAAPRRAAMATEMERNLLWLHAPFHRTRSDTTLIFLDGLRDYCRGVGVGTSTTSS